MASQTGSIDLTASNGVKLMAEAGFSSAARNYATKTELNVAAQGINADVTKIVDGLTQSSHFTQNADGFSFTLDDALEDAEKVATNYVTDITGGGVMIHPSDDDTTGVRITSDIDIMRDDTSVINIGTNDAVRIGVDDSQHVKLNLLPGAMMIDNESDDEIFVVEANSSGTTTETTTVNDVVVWSDINDVTTATCNITDASVASGDATAIVTVDNTQYELDSNQVTTVVTVGSNVTATLTSVGVTYVRGLMTVVEEDDDGVETTTYLQCSLSVSYFHTIADSAILIMDGRQTINGVRSVLTLNNDQWSSNNQTDNFMLAKTKGPSNKMYGVAFGVGSGGINRGVYDSTKGSWIIYRNSSGQTVINSSKVPTIINGTNFLVDSSGAVYAGRKVTVKGNRKVSLNASTVSGSVNRGVYDDSKSTWLIYRGNNTASGAETNYEFVAHGEVNNIALRSNSIGNRGLYDVTNNNWILYKNTSNVGVLLNEWYFSDHYASGTLQLGVPTYTTANGSKSVSSETDTTIGTIAIPAGRWLVALKMHFPNSSTGRRNFIFTSNRNASTSTSITNNAMAIPPTNGYATDVMIPYIVSHDSDETFYIIAYQNSGAAMTVGYAVRMFRQH